MRSKVRNPSPVCLFTVVVVVVATVAALMEENEKP